MHRRRLLTYASLIATTGIGFPGNAQGKHAMYGLIGKMIASPSHRDELIAILIEGTSGMPGCLSYIIAKDAADENAVWITEVWDSKDSHDASLSLAAVKNAIAKARPMITGFEKTADTIPVGGQGLK